jgi:hypothetical protein
MYKRDHTGEGSHPRHVPRSPNARDLWHPCSVVSLGLRDLGHPSASRTFFEASGGPWFPRSPNARDLGHPWSVVSLGLWDLGHPWSVVSLGLWDLGHLPMRM